MKTHLNNFEILGRLVPEQKEGSKTESVASKKMDSRTKAIHLFNEAKIRLCDINSWRHFCNDEGAEFQLTTRQGHYLETATPEVGNLIKIKLPAPSNKDGDGYDWVRIEKFEMVKDLRTDEELFGFRVRPVKNPGNKSTEAAHFYDGNATSSFLIYRNATRVYAIECGRNETINREGSFINKIRNIIVAIPAKLGLSKPQWQTLVEGLLQTYV